MKMLSLKRFFIFALTALILLFSAALGESAPKNKVAYVTFDDGPTLNTPKILDCLRSHNAGATFFVLKDRIELYPDFIKRMDAEGFAIGLHGVSHSTEIYATATGPLNEMNETGDALFRLIGRRSSIVRTPYGSKPNLSDRQRQLLETAGYKIYDWNVDPRDSIGAVVDKGAVLRNLKEGLKKAGDTAVVLLHDRKSTTDALDEILSIIEAEGYELKNLDEDVEF